MIVHVRQAATSDLEQIVSFNIDLAKETEGRQLDRATLTAGVNSVLTDVAKGTYLVATDDENTVIGQLMITTEWSDWRNGMIWWLQSVYVQASARRQCVFTALVNEVARLAALNPEVCGIRLYIEKDNQAARSTYEAAGFKAPGYDVMERLVS